MRLGRGMGAAITGCIGRRRRIGRVRHRRDPGRLLCAQIRHPVRAPLRHDLGRRSLDRHGPTRDRLPGLRRNGLRIPIDLPIRIDLKRLSGLQTRAFVASHKPAAPARNHAALKNSSSGKDQ
jgi:hypothetical protein